MARYSRIPPVRSGQARRSGGFFGKLIAVLLGFIFGVIATIGGIVGAGYYIVAKVTVKDAVNTVNKYAGTNINYSEYVTEEYASQTVLQLVGSLSTVAQEFSNGNGSLNTLNAISPKVGESVSNLLKALEEKDFTVTLDENGLVNTVSGIGLNLDYAELMSKKFSELGGYLNEQANAVEIGGVLEMFEQSSALLDAICYGEEYVDYVKDENGDIQMLGSSQKLTVGDLRSEGGLDFEKILTRIPLDALPLDTSDAIFSALIYGNENRYDRNDDGKATMKQMVFTVDNGELYDIDGNKMQASENDGVYTVTDGDDTYYVTEKDGSYVAFIDEELTIAKRYQKTTVSDLMSGSELFEKIELGTMFNESPLNENADPIMIALAYGEEGTHYELVDTNSDGTADTIKWLTDDHGNRYKPRTLGVFFDEDTDFMELLEDVKLATLLSVSPLDENADPLKVALAFGSEGTHYNIVDGELVWLTDPTTGEQYKARTLGVFFDPDTDLTELFYDVKLSTLLKVSPLDENADTMKVALAFGTEGTHYNIVDGEIVWLTDPTTGEQYKERTLGVFFDESTDLLTLFEDIQLGTLLKVSPLDENPDAIKLALAYGEEGTHYEIVDGEIVWLTDPTTGEQYKERTLGAIIGEDSDVTALFYDIKLGTLFEISPLDENPDKIKLALAYGTEGKHYEIEGGEIVWLTDPTTGEPYKARTIGIFFDENTDILELLYDVELSTLFEISPLDKYQGKPEPDAIKLSLAFGEEGKHYKLVDTNSDLIPDTIQWLTDPATGEKYAPRTLSIFFDENTDLAELFYDIKLATILEVDTSNKMMMALAYGNADRYTLVGDNVIMNPVPYAIVGGKVYNADYEQVSTATVVNDTLGVYKTTIDEKTVYLRKSGGVYFAYETQALAESANATDRITYKERTLNDLTGENATAIIDGIELGAVLETDVLTCSDELVRAIAYGYDGTHYDLIDNNSDGVADSVIWKVKDPITGERYKPRNLSDLENIGALFDDIRLSSALAITPDSHPIMIALAYGTEGTDFDYVYEGSNKVGFEPYTQPRTIADLKDNGTDLLNGIELTALFTDAKTDDKVTMYLLYGKEGVHYKLKADGEPELMKKRIAVYGTTVYDEYGNEIKNTTLNDLIYTDPNGNEYTLYTPVEGEQTVEVTVGTETKEATYYYLKDQSGKDVYFTPRTLGDLTTGDGIFGDITTALTVRDLMNDDETIDSHFILKHMADVPVADLPERIEGLTFQEVYASEIYKKDADGYYLNADGDYILDHNGNKFKEIHYNFHDKTFYTTETFEPETEVHLTLTGQWKYLLTRENQEEICQLTNITHLIENMSHNVHYAPLNDLVDDGLVELDDKTLLNDPITYNFGIDTIETYYYKDFDGHLIYDENGDPIKKTTIGELAVEELIDYVSSVLTISNKIF